MTYDILIKNGRVVDGSGSRAFNADIRIHSTRRRDNTLHRTALRIAAGVFCLFGCTAAIAQQAYPNKPMRFIVSTSPGSAMDGDGRIILKQLSESVGQPTVMDYKTGASGIIGMDFVAKATPDGYTLLFTGASFALVPLMDIKLPFDGIKAFAPVSLLGTRWVFLLAPPSLPANNAKEFVAYAKANPGVINMGNSGPGKSLHLAGLWIQALTGINMTFINYKGGGEILPDLTAGRIHLAIATSSAVPLIKAGKVKALGLANLKRNPTFPDLPTLDEQGWKDFEYFSWLGVLAPAKTPAAIVNRMSAELARAVKSPELVKQMANETQLIGSTPEEFQRAINSHTERVSKIVKENNIKLLFD